GCGRRLATGNAGVICRAACRIRRGVRILTEAGTHRDGQHPQEITRGGDRGGSDGAGAPSRFLLRLARGETEGDPRAVVSTTPAVGRTVMPGAERGVVAVGARMVVGRGRSRRAGLPDDRARTVARSDGHALVRVSG